MIESAELAVYEHTNLDGVSCVLEEFVPFDREVAIVGARSSTGETRFYPIVETHQEKGILRYAYVRNEGRSALQREAEKILGKLLTSFDYVGVLALEMFVVGDRLLANEMAPRVHNSAHWTDRGAKTSQFENHLRAILGWPLGPTDALGEIRFANLIGGEPDVADLLGVEGALVSLYGKTLSPGRKLGHVTLVGDGAELDARFSKLRALIDDATVLRGPGT